MKSKFKLSLMAIVVMAFISQGCFVEDDDGEVIEKFAWQKSDAFNEGLYNSKVIDQQLVVMGASSVYYNASITNQASPTPLGNFLSRTGFFKLPIDRNLLVTRTENDLRIFPANNINQNSSFHIRGNQLDPDFVEFDNVPFWNSPAYGLNSKGTILIGYRAMDERNIAENNPSFMLIKTSRASGNVQVVSKQIVKPTGFTYFATTTLIESFDDFFIIRAGTATVAIYEDGSFEQINRLQTKAINLDGRIIALGIDKAAGALVFHEYGGQWSVTNTYKVSNNIVLDGNFTTIDNQIYSYVRDRIFRLDMSGSNITAVELDNSRLTGGIITSLTKIDANTVFATLACEGVDSDRCGGFFKSMEDFHVTKAQ